MSLKNKEEYIKLYEKYGEIQVKCRGADLLPIDAINDFQKGLKKRTAKNKLRLATLIFQQGFSFPFFIWQHDGEYFCLDGHGRSDVLCEIRKSGIPIPGMFPVDYIEAETIEEAREKLLAASSQYGEWSEDELTEWLKDIDKEIREQFRVVDKELNIAIREETNNDDDIPDVDEAITKSGDMWELGNHRLLCGDSSREEDIEKLMGEDKADMVFTDPPYGVAIGDKNKLLDTIEKAERIKENITNDNLPINELKEILIKVFIIQKKINNKHCSYYVTAPQGGSLGMMMMMMMSDAGLPIRHIIIWVKNKQCFSFGHLDYEYQHEPILYTWGEKHKYYGNGFYKSSVWKIDKEIKCDKHPTMKPVELIENALLNSSEKGNIISDPFLGSGSTMIACEKTDRMCRGMEIDPHYCDVIVERYRQWCIDNNKKPEIKLNGEHYNF